MKELSIEILEKTEGGKDKCSAFDFTLYAGGMVVGGAGALAYFQDNKYFAGGAYVSYGLANTLALINCI